MTGWLLAAQIAVVARGPDTATTCRPIELAVAARSGGASVPRITVPSTSGVELLRTSLASRTEREPDGPSTLTEGTLMVALDAIGRVIVPIVVNDDAGHSRTARISIDVHEDPSVGPVVMVRARLDAGDGRRADSIFVGQQVDYVVDVQLNETARQRLRRNPTFFPPDMPSVLAYDLPAPEPITREGRRCFESLSYHRALFPLFPGQVSISPARLSYSLPLSTSFFSREESYELHTDGVRFVAVEPPAAGRPADYGGAVGGVRASASLSPASARMGDPLTLTLRLDATGNVKLLPRPTVTLDWASVAPAEERVTVDSTAARVRGTKEFDWVVTPRVAGRQRVPAIRYPSFDPDRRGYEVVVTDSIEVDVASASLASADTVQSVRLPIRTTLRSERPAPLTTQPWYWALLLASPLPAALRGARIRRRRHATRRSPLQRLRRLAGGAGVPRAQELRRTFLDAIREQVPAAGMPTGGGSLARTLRRAGVTDATAERAEALLADLDLSAFGGVRTGDACLAARALEIAAAIEHEAMRAMSRVRPAMLTVMLVLGAASSTLLALPDGVERTFEAGVLAYRHADWPNAERLFGRVAARTPRAVDAWANFGTAAWAASDTARAMVGWQRALRLDPLDGEMRDRVALVRSSSALAPASVPALPADGVAAAALACWLATWLLLALPAHRRPARARTLSTLALAASVALLAVALELNDRASGRGLGAVRTSRALLEAPDPTAGPAAEASAGEVGALGAREGAWIRITLDEGRTGWLPFAAVLPLDGPAGAD